MTPGLWAAFLYGVGVCGGIAAGGQGNMDDPAAMRPVVVQVAPGIWRYRFGEPERFTPTSFRSRPIRSEALKEMPAMEVPPLKAEAIRFDPMERGCSLLLPLGAQERIYGLGLNTRVFEKSNKRQKLIPSDAPEDAAGPSHAPVPFYVSTAGYGVDVDTARFTSFYAGDVAPIEDAAQAASGSGLATSTSELYPARALAARHMMVDIPAAHGVNVYLFAGPKLLDAVRRYVLFSGGGPVPPLWGLGVAYRGKTDFTEEDCVKLAQSFREQHIPCDVFGLESGWQTHAYSGTFVWEKGRFPDPDRYCRRMREMNCHLSVWQHAFTHPDSPLYDRLKALSGSYRVWEGLVPDFAGPAARKLFGDYHDKTLFAKGVDSVKLDECDYQPFGPEPWSFPEEARFPSGLDGEQMHSVFGILYQQALLAPMVARNQRTWGLARNSGSLAAPLPYVIYSDSYDHGCYIRGLVNQGFCGLLWVPEVRDSGSLEELYRRVETVVFAPQTLINPWYMKLPPWLQINAEKSNRGEVMAEHEQATAIVRKLFELRMSLVPYLYSAFNDYHRTGTPPIRALVMDWPGDPETDRVDDEFLFGPSLLVAPMLAAQTNRSVYLPPGRWCDFWTKDVVPGGGRVDVRKPAGQIPVFVRENSLVPIAKPVEFTRPDTCFDLEVRVYGKAPRSFLLYEDDGETNDWQDGNQNTVTLRWDGNEGHVARSGPYSGPPRYRIERWTEVGNYDRVTAFPLVNGGFADNARDFAADNATGYVSQCKPIIGWHASDPGRIGVQPLVNGLRNARPPHRERPCIEYPGRRWV